MAFQSRVGRGVSKSVASWYRDTSILDGNAQFRSDSHRSNVLSSEAAPLLGIALSWSELVRDLSAREDR